MFDKLEMAPPDPILGLQEAFNRDPNPAKVNLSVGVYKDASGQTPVLRAVKRAEERILRQEITKDYLGIAGSSEYAAAVQRLLFGQGHEAIAGSLAVTAHTPGGTGALRVAGELLQRARPGLCIWLSEPTWPNHLNVFRASGLAIKTYPYFDAEANDLAFDRMVAAMRQIPEGDVILLHGCCHNPTGIDPTPDQWLEIAQVVAECGLLPLVDLAYQGLAEGIREDTVGVLSLYKPGREMLIASSFSKNFGLYNERVGALTGVATSQDTAAAVLSQMKRCIRANYSNPPAHGAAIVTTVLDDPTLCADWETELQGMCERIRQMRRLFVETLAAKGVQRDFSFVSRQRGMFSYSGLTPWQVESLRQDHSVYVVGDGRINVAGMTEANMGVLCQAIADVLQAF